MSTSLQLTPRRLVVLALVVLVVLLGYQRMTRRPARTPEAAISALIDDGASAARDGRVGDMVALVSEAYRGGDDGGPSSRDELRRYLALGLAQGAEVRVLDRRIEVHGATAHARLAVVVVAGGVRGLASGRAGARDLELELALEGRAWRVVASRAASFGVVP